MARIVGILGGGMVATLLFTAFVTVGIRAAVKTPVVPVPKGQVCVSLMGLCAGLYTCNRRTWQLLCSRWSAWHSATL